VQARLCIVRVLAAGTPADGGRRSPADGGRRSPADGGRADIPAGGGQADTPAGATLYNRGGYMLALWERGDAEGAPSGRQGRCVNPPALVHVGPKRREGEDNDT
jgi:hypothetical protein